jgi:endonuclease YncB( thermonuclease family)
MRFILIALSVSISFNLYAKKFEDVLVARDWYVIDGDTMEAKIELGENSYVKTKIRLLGIDAPEMAGECEKEIEGAKKAKEKLEEILKNDSFVYLKNIANDKYGRVLANLFLSENDKVSVSYMMLKSGLVVGYGGKKRQSWCK